MSKLTSDKSIESLVLRVLDARLPKEEWTHAAHFALAVWILRHRPYLAEPDGFRSIIIRLNDHHGTPNTDSEGYHHTITLASIRAARSVLESHRDTVPLSDVLADLLARPLGRPGWIFEYWTPELLFSVEARKDWVEPDIVELPF